MEGIILLQGLCGSDSCSYPWISFLDCSGELVVGRISELTLTCKIHCLQLIYTCNSVREGETGSQQWRR